MRSALCTHLVT